MLIMVKAAYAPVEPAEPSEKEKHDLLCAARMEGRQPCWARVLVAKDGALMEEPVLRRVLELPEST